MAFTINGTTGIDLGTQPLTGSLPKAQLPSGTVLQVINSTLSTQLTSSNNSFVTTGFNAVITPTSTSSRILVQMCLYCYAQGNGANQDMGMNFQIDRNGTKVFNNAGNNYPGFYISGYPATRTTDNIRGIVNISYIDSPSSTSALTYTLFWAKYNNSSSIAINNDLPEISSIILTEIA
jgi:hypothetical protein